MSVFLSSFPCLFPAQTEKRQLARRAQFNRCTKKQFEKRYSRDAFKNAKERNAVEYAIQLFHDHKYIGIQVRRRNQIFFLFSLLSAGMTICRHFKDRMFFLYKTLFMTTPGVEFRHCCNTLWLHIIYCVVFLLPDLLFIMLMAASAGVLLLMGPLIDWLHCALSFVFIYGAALMKKRGSFSIQYEIRLIVNFELSKEIIGHEDGDALMVVRSKEYRSIFYTKPNAANEIFSFKKSAVESLFEGMDSWDSYGYMTNLTCDLEHEDILSLPDFYLRRWKIVTGEVDPAVTARQLAWCEHQTSRNQPTVLKVKPDPILQKPWAAAVHTPIASPVHIEMPRLLEQELAEHYQQSARDTMASEVNDHSNVHPNALPVYDEPV
eukprot:GILK01005123.1.p1 GENE.GILK01005123.1~~GILK01005123.1.p1  ORF type:complete len:391 (-),score=57.19 GILK01005123.1:236-1366(-)